MQSKLSKRASDEAVETIMNLMLDTVIDVSKEANANAQAIRHLIDAIACLQMEIDLLEQKVKSYEH